MHPVFAPCPHCAAPLTLRPAQPYGRCSACHTPSVITWPAGQPPQLVSFETAAAQAPAEARPAGQLDEAIQDAQIGLTIAEVAFQNAGAAYQWADDSCQQAERQALTRLTAAGVVTVVVWSLALAPLPAPFGYVFLAAAVVVTGVLGWLAVAHVNLKRSSETKLAAGRETVELAAEDVETAEAKLVDLEFEKEFLSLAAARRGAG